MSYVAEDGRKGRVWAFVMVLGYSALPQGICYRSGAIASHRCYRNQVVAS